jgi:hypothetical protein
VAVGSARVVLMRQWLGTRGRALLSFLSDLGGALVFVTAALGLIAAAVVGAVLFALTAFPQPFFTFLVLGVGLLVAGLTVHFLRDRLAPEPQQAPAVGVKRNPYSDAILAQRQHDEAKRAQAEREQALKLRRAVRRITEELRDNLALLERDDVFWEEGYRDSHWREEQTVLLDHHDAAPYQAAREAYRRIGGVFSGRSIVDDWGNVHMRGDTPYPHEDVKRTRASITHAISTLETVEQGD